MATTPITEETWDSLGEVVQLLHRAAQHIWRDADHAGVGSPLHSLAIGVFIAAGQATTLLPETWPLTLVELGEVNPLQLLRSAEELTRTDALNPGTVDGLSAVAVTVCDLIREAQASGY